MDAQKLRIAVLSVHSSPVGELGAKDTGGMSVYVRELARELRNRGHLIDIYTRLNDSREYQIAELYDNVRLIHLRAGNSDTMNKLALYSHLDDFFNELKGFRSRESLDYDLIHSHYWLSGRVGDWAQQQWAVPHVFMFHTVGAMKNISAVVEQEPELRIATERHLAKTCHRILVATEREREQLVLHYNAHPETVGVVPCGVNLDVFCPVDKTRARQQLGFNRDESIVLFVGRFSPLKGIDRLLESLSHLKHRKRLRLVIVGGDGKKAPESRNLQGLSQEWGVQDRVTFAGRIEHQSLPLYYSAADVLVVPSLYESFGLVALESLASGTPVVATRVGAMEHLIKEGETGHVVSNGSPRLLANAIETFVSGRNTLSAEEIRGSVLKFSWANVASALLEEYTKVLGQYHEALN